MHRTWAEINLDNIQHNFSEISRFLEAHHLRKVKVMAVVKANAYGHGAIAVARALQDSGANYLAVATLDEALELRSSDITLPILILNHIDQDQLDDVIRHDLTCTLYSEKMALAMSDAANKKTSRIKVHIKIDTGMNRVGLRRDTALAEIMRYRNLPGLEMEGIYTHFAVADEADPAYTDFQFQAFSALLEDLQKNGVNIPIRHACNSAAIFKYPQMHLDMVRPGISLYGYFPSEVSRTAGLCLKPAMTLKTKVLRISQVDPGTSVSYGRRFIAAKQTCLATLPIGYADGYSRMLSCQGNVLIKGEIAPIVGTICMDQTVVDISRICGPVSVGTEVVVMGQQDGNEIQADTIGDLIGTISYEVVCSVARRVPRYYFKQGELICSENYLVPNHEK